MFPDVCGGEGGDPVGDADQPGPVDPLTGGVAGAARLSPVRAAQRTPRLDGGATWQQAPPTHAGGCSADQRAGLNVERRSTTARRAGWAARLITTLAVIVALTERAARWKRQPARYRGGLRTACRAKVRGHATGRTGDVRVRPRLPGRLRDAGTRAGSAEPGARDRRGATGEPGVPPAGAGRRDRPARPRARDGAVVAGRARIDHCPTNNRAPADRQSQPVPGPNPAWAGRERRAGCPPARTRRGAPLCNALRSGRGCASSGPRRTMA